MTESTALPVLPEFDPPHPALAESAFYIIGQVTEVESGQNYRTTAAAEGAADLLETIGDLLFPDSGEFSAEEMVVIAQIGKTLSDLPCWSENTAIGEPLDANIGFVDDGFRVNLQVIALITSGEEE